VFGFTRQAQLPGSLTAVDVITDTYWLRVWKAAGGLGRLGERHRERVRKRVRN